MKRTLCAAALAAIAPAWAPAWAQNAPQQVVITGNPLGRGDVATPSSVLAGDGLVMRRASTLGETLDGMPGVSSTGFGRNASRPVIRGQDGDRIRVLSNAGASFDASSLSFDHAVAIDPLVVERLEVLRGPAALLYGGSAVGGVVNAIDNRIPKSQGSAFSGAVETRLGGAANEGAGSALVEGGGQGLMIHADAFHRRSGDLRVPAFDRPLGDGTSEKRTRVANSASKAAGGALGGSWVWNNGYLGASVDSYRNDYGTVAEDDITIRMRRGKVTLAGEARALGGALGRIFDSVRGQLGNTDYEHQEVEGDGRIGTTFKSRGHDGRLELNHRALPVGTGRLEGTWGVQWEAMRFSALGEEAFVPSTRTRQAALFVLERWQWSEAGHVSAGLRAEQVHVRSAGDPDPAAAQFGAAQERRFAPRNVSLAAVLLVNNAWQLSANAAVTQRAPTHYELYANGVHAATGAFEVGDAAQRLERGRNIDLGLAWRSGANHVKLGAFDSRFAHYILLSATDTEHVDDAGNRYPVFHFNGVRARLYGLEAEAAWQLSKGALDTRVDARLDWVRGRNQDSGEPLPRLAPLRATLGLEVGQGGWSARAEIQHARRQTDVPASEQPTAGYKLVNLSVRYRLPLGPGDALLFVKLHNAGNQLATNASTTSTLRALSPLPGRALSTGVRFTY